MSGERASRGESRVDTDWRKLAWNWKIEITRPNHGTAHTHTSSTWCQGKFTKLVTKIAVNSSVWPPVPVALFNHSTVLSSAAFPEALQVIVHVAAAWGTAGRTDGGCDRNFAGFLACCLYLHLSLTSHLLPTDCLYSMVRLTGGGHEDNRQHGMRPGHTMNALSVCVCASVYKRQRRRIVKERIKCVRIRRKTTVRGYKAVRHHDILDWVESRASFCPDMVA
ncbi:hypothetical protein ElyMa_006049900 [Elysia marginata]|uniref:Uncharacterized protein n=1 Tax=Elysia marginata TaxID=1093978 RepID=A0AAV4GML0_9GAST|nr:hypothetical protein ElyMa_006049900 [Elysia marginata]